ncbi:MAG: D-sedoheptulose-7-phosphate isomerase [Rhodospirillales bacterium]|jgi:D-sedoheptulose 7-phosphate isomerase
MTFPDQKFPDMASYGDAYFEQLKIAAASVDRAALSQAADRLEAAYAKGATLYVCGNGGSAAISNHLICDHLKLIRTDTDLVPRVVSLSTNIETITAIANDISYDDVFVYQLESLGRKDDVLMTISSSGDSENVVRAATWAKENGLGMIALTGFAGGRTATIADINVHVQSDNYGVIEDVHQSVMHMLAQYVRQKQMDKPLIQQRKF